MLINLVLNKEIINECLKVHYAEKQNSRRLTQRLILIPVALVGLGIYLIYSELQRSIPGQNLYMGFLYIGFAASYYFFMRYRTIKGGGQLLKTLGSHSSFTMNVDAEKLVTTTTSGSFDTTWDAFTKAIVSTDNVLIYQADNTFSMFNRRFFTGNDFDDFKKLVREKVGIISEG
jgi:hypothetical protein